VKIFQINKIKTSFKLVTTITKISCTVVKHSQMQVLQIEVGEEDMKEKGKEDRQV
jgi:hypothetical protein